MIGPTGPEAPGLIHPTAAAATASLGLLIVLAAAAFPRWVWARRWLLPMLVVQGLAVYVAQRRTAVALVAALVPGIFWFSVGRRARTVAVVAILIAAVAYVASDTRLVRLSAASSAVAGYLRRGDSSEQLRSLNGRAELWGKMANQVTKAPLIGHGYFVTCEGGEIDVWGRRRAITAHNVFLQVLASTGIIGLLLFLWGLWRPLATAARGLRDQGLRNLLAVLLLFYLGWGMLTDSFMGPVRAESIVFFALLGVAVARAQSSTVP